ncbi:MAG: hypothetical protein WBO54_17600, partial [Thermoanaerobaculia bacterium]
ISSRISRSLGDEEKTGFTSGSYRSHGDLCAAAGSWLGLDRLTVISWRVCTSRSAAVLSLAAGVGSPEACPPEPLEG